MWCVDCVALSYCEASLCYIVEGAHCIFYVLHITTLLLTTVFDIHCI